MARSQGLSLNLKLWTVLSVTVPVIRAGRLRNRSSVCSKFRDFNLLHIFCGCGLHLVSYSVGIGVLFPIRKCLKHATNDCRPVSMYGIQAAVPPCPHAHIHGVMVNY